MAQIFYMWWSWWSVIHENRLICAEIGVGAPMKCGRRTSFDRGTRKGSSADGRDCVLWRPLKKCCKNYICNLLREGVQLDMIKSDKSSGLHPGSTFHNFKKAQIIMIILNSNFFFSSQRLIRCQQKMMNILKKEIRLFSEIDNR